MPWMPRPALPRLRRLPARTAAVSAIATLAAGLLPGAARAVENGAPITPVGVYDFGAGMLPPPSELGMVGLRLSATRATQLRDNSGSTAPVSPRLAVDSISVAFIRMTSLTLGSARYGYGAVLPALDMSLDMQVPTPVGPQPLSGRNRAVGDVLLLPLLLQWAPSPGLFTNLQLGVQAPTGAYDKNRLINTGSNHWTLAPSVAFTAISPGGLELSSNIQLSVHTRNRATQYRSGMEVQQEFALGQHVGPWTAGLGGYLYQQLGDDAGPGLKNGNRSRVKALGPALAYFAPGSGMPALWAHVYKEFDARNRSQGTQLTLRSAWVF